MEIKKEEDSFQQGSRLKGGVDVAARSFNASGRILGARGQPGSCVTTLFVSLSYLLDTRCCFRVHLIRVSRVVGLMLHQGLSLSALGLTTSVSPKHREKEN